MIYPSPNEDGKLLLKHALFFQQTLGMRVFICSINDKPPLLKKLFNPDKKQFKENITPEKLRKFTQSAIPDKALEHFSFRVKKDKRLPLLIRQSNKGRYEFIIVDKSNSETALNPGEIDRLISHSYCPVMAVHKKVEY